MCPSFSFVSRVLSTTQRKSNLQSIISTLQWMASQVIAFDCNHHNHSHLLAQCIYNLTLIKVLFVFSFFLFSFPNILEPFI